MKFIGIIPARYASSRFPGKPLIDIKGKIMIRRVYERASLALDTVYVATDHKDIKKEVESFGGKVVMTSTQHKTGTDRLVEAIEKIHQNTSKKYDVILNIQGDEPFIHVEQLELLQNIFDENTEIATLVKKIENTEDIFNVNRPKVVFNDNNEAMYFSRSPIPHIRNEEHENWLEKMDFYKHIGIYAYRYEVLQKIAKLPQSSLELAESLEQIRWLQSGYKIKIAVTKHESMAVDTKEDLQEILRSLEV